MIPLLPSEARAFNFAGRKMLVPLFNPERIQIDTIDLSVLDRDARMDAMRRAHGLPHLGQFLAEIERMQSDENDRFGRRYQRETLASDGLWLVSPLSGEPVVARESFAVGSKKFFRFAEANNSGEHATYFVISSRVHFGFPLAALFVPSENWLLTWEPGGRRAVGAHHLQALAQALAQDELPLRLPLRTVITMGHVNFAHHLWNELSALETIIHSGSLRTDTSILVARETLGPLEQIFPELKNNTIYRVGDNKPPGSVRRGALFVNVGALRIPQSMRRRIAAFALNKASAAARVIIATLKRNAGPAFWISVRTQDRTLVDQRETFARIAGQLLNEHRRCSIVFDGFSLPEDWKRAGDEMQSFYRNTASETQKECAAIIAAVKSSVTLSPSQTIASTAGMGLLDSIAIAQSATAYLCHSGTVQHKIGWTATVPGMVHGHRGPRIDDLGLWHSQKLEEGIVPVVVPRAFFDNVVPQVEKRRHNYRSIDPETFARFVAEYFRSCISLVPPDQERHMV